MSYHHTDQSRENEPYALLDVEAFECTCPLKWSGHGEPTRDHRHPDLDCPVASINDHERGYYYAFGLPGCLWDSDPVGPFETKEEALREARESAGF